MNDAKNISIRREHGFYAIFRKLCVYVDGTKKLEIKPNETLSMTLPSGAQELYLQMDWVKTNPLDLSGVLDGDMLVIRVRKRKFSEYISINTMPFVINIER